MSCPLMSCYVRSCHITPHTYNTPPGNITSTYSTDATQDSPRHLKRSWQFDSEQVAQTECTQMVQIGSDFRTGKAFQSNSGRTIQAEWNMMAQNGSKSSTSCNIGPTHFNKDFSEVEYCALPQLRFKFKVQDWVILSQELLISSQDLVIPKQD